MRIKKIDLMEIVNSDGELIGNDAIPHNGSDLESQANNTTDYNRTISTQPFRYDFLGRMGFGFMPYMEEGKENDHLKNLLDDLAHLAYDRYMEILEYYYRNPNKLKSDFRIMSQSDFDSQSADKKDKNFECANKMLEIVEKHFKDAFEKSDNIVEDKMIEKKNDNEFAKKGKDNEVGDKNLKKVADLITKKFEKKEIDRLINLLEIKIPKKEIEFSAEQQEKD
jgi:hypothetical protein